jgi:hypothetical protein
MKAAFTVWMQKKTIDSRWGIEEKQPVGYMRL